jgi:hypothetical protein
MVFWLMIRVVQPKANRFDTKCCYTKQACSVLVDDHGGAQNKGKPFSYDLLLNKGGF